MSRRMAGLVTLLICSELLGVFSGHWFFGIYVETVPPALTTDFNRSAAYSYFLVWGAVLGFVIFLWALLAVGLARFFRNPTETPAPLPRADGR